MSRIQIIHETAYTYRSAVRFGPHRLVLRPREGHDIHVDEMKLQVEPACSIGWSRDVFGNSIGHAIFHEPSTVLRIRNELLLRLTQPFHARDVGRTVSYPVQYSRNESAVAAAYQAPVYPNDIPAMQSWVADIAMGSEGADAESVVAWVNRRVFETIRYKRREEQGVQSPAETLREAAGSCRDMATLLLEALRVLGFPARFASGYLDCRASEAGRASTHAWAEAYLPEVGWVGFDPTSGEPTSTKHVVVGVSNHPRGVMPISGSFYGKPEEYVGMEVTVSTDRVEPALTPSAIAAAMGTPMLI